MRVRIRRAMVFRAQLQQQRRSQRKYRREHQTKAGKSQKRSRAILTQQMDVLIVRQQLHVLRALIEYESFESPAAGQRDFCPSRDCVVARGLQGSEE